MSNVDIAIACALLAAAAIVFILGVQPDASDSAPHRTKLDELMTAGTPFTKICAICDSNSARENTPSRITKKSNSPSKSRPRVS